MSDFKNHSIMEELRRAYLKSLAAKMEELAAAIAGQDHRAAVRIGHQLKGSGKSYGFPDVSDLGATIEEAAANRRFAQLETLLFEMRNLKTVKTIPDSPLERE